MGPGRLLVHVRGEGWYRESTPTTPRGHDPITATKARAMAGSPEVDKAFTIIQRMKGFHDR